MVAIGLISGLKREGISVPNDISVVGFDDIEDGRDSYPPLTTVSCNIPDFAKSTAAQIVSWIKDGTTPPPTARSSVALIKRQSSLGAKAAP